MKIKIKIESQKSLIKLKKGNAIKFDNNFQKKIFMVRINFKKAIYDV